MVGPRHLWLALVALGAGCTAPDAPTSLEAPPSLTTPDATSPVVPRELLVRAASRDGVADLGEVRPGPLPGWWRLRVPTGADVEAARAELRARPMIEATQYNLRYTPDLRPSDPDYPRQYAHQRADAELGWDVRTDAPGVVVAVIGTGVDRTHPDLARQLWSNPGEIPGNGQDDDGNGFVDDVWGWDFRDDDAAPDPTDDHETAVACVIGAQANNGGVAGVIWDASLMALRVRYQSDQVAAAIRYAVDNGARVINMSFGSYVTNKYGPDGVVREALDYAEAAGVLAVATAGNDAVDRLRYPAAADTVLGVGASNAADRRAAFSNFGGWISVAAPGDQILSCTRGGGHDLVNGTSYAAPYVAGVAALARAEHPEWTVAELRYVLETSGDALGVDQQIGETRINLQGALSAPGFPSALARIRRPYEGAVLFSGETVEIVGTALGGAWEVELVDTTRVGSGSTEVIDGLLGTIDTSQFDVGSYTLRLRLNSGLGVDEVTLRIERPGLDGFPVRATGAATDISVGDVDGDGNLDVVVCNTAGEVHIVRGDGSPLPGFPTSFGGQVGGVALADLDGDGDVEVLASTRPEESSGRLFAWHHDGRPVSGWDNRLSGRVHGGPAFADVDADGALEVIVVTLDMQGLLLSVFEADGRFAPSSPSRPPPGYEIPFIGSRQALAVANLDEDPQLEIAVAGKHLWVFDAQGLPEAGWPVEVNATRVVAADFDDDGIAELVTGGAGSSLGFQGDGSPLFGWPQLSGSTDANVAVGDVFGDGRPDVVAMARDGIVRIWRPDGQGTPGWPKRLQETTAGYLRSGPVLADLDGDAVSDILVLAHDGTLHAWRADGSIVPGFPAATEFQPRVVPVLADLDASGTLDMMVGGLPPTGGLFALDLNAAGRPAHIGWDRLGGNPHHTNAFPRRFPLTASAPREGQVRLTFAAPPDVFAPRRYAIFRDANQVGTSTVPTWLDVGLDRRAHTYEVVAYDETASPRARSLELAVAWPDVFCVGRADGATCDDGNRCTTADACAADQCVGRDDDGAACDDGSACSAVDLCRGGRCVGEQVTTCTAEPCRAAYCNPVDGECVDRPAPDGSLCDDGDACTGNDACREGVCVGAIYDCNLGDDQCGARGVCDPTTGECSTPMMPDGTACDDGDGCTTDDVCRAGVCESAPITCQPIPDCPSLPVCDADLGQCVAPEGCRLDGGGLEGNGDGCGCTASEGPGATSGGWWFGLLGLLGLRLSRPRA